MYLTGRGYPKTHFILFWWIPTLKPHQSSPLGPNSQTESTMTAASGKGALIGKRVWSQGLDPRSNWILFLPGVRVSMAFKTPNSCCNDTSVNRGNNRVLGDHPPTYSQKKKRSRLLRKKHILAEKEKISPKISYTKNSWGGAGGAGTRTLARPRWHHSYPFFKITHSFRWCYLIHNPLHFGCLGIPCPHESACVSLLLRSSTSLSIASRSTTSPFSATRHLTCP